MRATLDTLVLVAIGSLASLVLAAIGLAHLVILAAPLSIAPWTLVTSVYAHASLGHLLANAIALLIVGPLVERRTTRWRFHAFFITTGAIAGAAEVLLGGVVGPGRAVLGASGAVFALLGYLLAGNVVSTRLLDRVQLGAKTQLLLFVCIAIGITIATGAPGVALIAHGTGLLLGLAAGRLRLLDVRGRP